MVEFLYFNTLVPKLGGRPPWGHIHIAGEAQAVITK